MPGQTRPLCVVKLLSLCIIITELLLILHWIQISAEIMQLLIPIRGSHSGPTRLKSHYCSFIFIPFFLISGSFHLTNNARRRITLGLAATRRFRRHQPGGNEGVETPGASHWSPGPSQPSHWSDRGTAPVGKRTTGSR